MKTFLVLFNLEIWVSELLFQFVFVYVFVSKFQSFIEIGGFELNWYLSPLQDFEFEL